MSWLYENTACTRVTATYGLKKAADITARGNTPRPKYTMKYRKDVQMGELFSLDENTDRVFLHTGKRTVPPSDARASSKTYGTVNGKPIVGFQALLIRGKAEDDGNFYTTEGWKKVSIVGHAKIMPTYH